MCDECARAKTKCDKQRPCHNCVKSGAACKYINGHSSDKSSSVDLGRTTFESQTNIGVYGDINSHWIPSELSTGLNLQASAFNGWPNSDREIFTDPNQTFEDVLGLGYLDFEGDFWSTTRSHVAGLVNNHQGADLSSMLSLYEEPQGGEMTTMDPYIIETCHYLVLRRKRLTNYRYRTITNFLNCGRVCGQDTSELLIIWTN